MTRTLLLAIAVAGTAVAAENSVAALFSSSRMINQVRTSGVRVVSYAYTPDDTPIYQRSFNPIGKLLAGVTSATVSADTEADTATIDVMEIAPFEVTPSTAEDGFSANITIVETPANFPTPPILKHVSGQWRERISINGVTGGPLTFVSSTAGALEPLLTMPPWFISYQDVTLATSNFTLSGVYEVIGPETTVTVPFNVDFIARNFTSSSTSGGASVRVRGGPQFGDDFAFALDAYAIFEPVDPLIYDGVVDGMRFGANFEESFFVDLTRGSFIPEPGSFWLSGAALACLAGCVRKRSMPRAPST